MEEVFDIVGSSSSSSTAVHSITSFFNFKIPSATLGGIDPPGFTPLVS